MFSLYLNLGFDHILTIEAIDHLAFLLVLISSVKPTEMRKMIGLITGFTIGHSLSLFAATTGIISVNMDVVEFLIPLTIAVSAVLNLIMNQIRIKQSNLIILITVSFFGLIHGLGYSNYLSGALANSGESIFIPLLGFNIGVELAQLLLVVPVLLLGSYLFKWFPKLNPKLWVYSGSILGLLISLYLIFS